MWEIRRRYGINAIAFQSVVKNNSIQLPEQYRLDAEVPVFVTITLMAEDKPIIIPRRKTGPFTAANFSAAKIDTTGWKFNREEANER